ncbi:unnamed protein product [Allacma fusca]|uniref:Uncharacterized protein n=1 Tax=Allacma fusca TaxID=39272 RepID=A0A8J2L0D1_9HEXA|nr:unnamed protein product [Allacma fusca]
MKAGKTSEISGVSPAHLALLRTALGAFHGKLNVRLNPGETAESGSEVLEELGAHGIEFPDDSLKGDLFLFWEWADSLLTPHKKLE